MWWNCCLSVGRSRTSRRAGVTALMLAAARGSDTAIIGDLLRAGASVNQTSIDKSTALMSAISDGGDIRNDYQHILAMKKPDAPVEEESTLDKIVGATAAKSLATGNRALMTEDMALQLAPGAFKKNVDEIVALLLKHGADVKAVNASGESAFSSLSITRDRRKPSRRWPTPGRTPARRINPAPHR